MSQVVAPRRSLGKASMALMVFKPEGVKILISVVSGIAEILMLRALTRRKMPNTFEEFHQDAKNANCAEFDGIEVHATNR